MQLHARRNEQFGNAREMRNLFEAAVRNQSTRLVASGRYDREALISLLPEDLPANMEPGIPSAPFVNPSSSRIAPQSG
jgi:hypothetical protein